MKLWDKAGACGAALLAITAFGAPAGAQDAPPLPPLPHWALQQLHDDPAAWAAFRTQHAAVPARRAPEVAPTVAPLAWTEAWSNLYLSNPLLLTDGTVLAHVSCTRFWYRLTPDNTGSYLHGKWAQTAPMPAGYAPRFFASGVLPDGRVVVEGGEYNGSQCKDVETTLGAIYDPVANTWAAIKPPTGWSTVGDSSSIVLPDGAFLLSNCCTTQLATLNPATLKWSVAGATGKLDVNNEENWTLLPNGDVLTIDAYVASPTLHTIACGMGSELYNPAGGTWTSAGSTVHRVVGCGGTIQNFEAPTQILRPTGQMVAFGATAATTNLPVWTASYATATGKWSSAVSMPKVGGMYYTTADAPAAILANGSALIGASPGVWATAFGTGSFPSPTHFFTFTGTAFSQIGDVGDTPSLSSFEVNFLVLPTGEILEVETDFPNSEILPAVCCASAGWAPSIAKLSSKVLAAGGTFTVTGKQLSGRTQGATFGDDVQADTNFPLVRITNTATSHVRYARTFGFTRSIAVSAASSTSFQVPATIEIGPSTLVVVANGIPSKPITVTVIPAAE